MNKPTRSLTSLLAAAVMTLSLVGTSAASAAPAQPARPAQPAQPARLKGVDPAFYLQKRNHQPDVMQELTALNADVAVSVLANPERFVVEAGQSKAARDVELRALRQGALASLAERGDPRAAAVLQTFVDDADVLVAAVALERLGQTQQPAVVAVLAAVLADDGTTLPRRAAAAAGLGRHRSAAALDVLVPALDDKDDQVRISAMRALGSLSSRWAWQARASRAGPAGPQLLKTDEALRARSLAAVSAVDGSPAVVAARDEVLGLLR